MKRLLYILTCTLLTSLVVKAYDCYRIENAPEVTRHDDITLYKYYLCTGGYPNGGALIFNPDFTFYYNDEYAGEWRISNDTLTLYESYREKSPLTEDDMKELGLWDSVNNIGFKYCYPNHRQVINLEPKGDYPFAGNVSMYKIYNYGDSIVSLYEEFTFPDYYPTFIYTTKHYYYNKPKNVGGYVEHAFASKKSSYEYEQIISYRPWHNVSLSWTNGELKVVDKTAICGKTSIVDLECDSITYHVVNPRFYLKNDTAQLYDPSEEEVLSNWMDTVSVGKSYNFQLQRPAYPADSIKNIPQLQSDPNTLYIGEKEAYGYFFARIKND